MVNRAFGVVLREFRRRAGLSQEGLAETADLHRTEISLLERGLRTPSLETLVALAGALNVPLTDMIALFEREMSRAQALSASESESGDADAPRRSRSLEATR